MTTNYPLVLLSSGQTGVERGAYSTAKALGISVAGVIRNNRRDELGPVPDELARLLVPCTELGPRRARVANVYAAWGVIVVVNDADHPSRVTGMKDVMHCARVRNLPLCVCGPRTDLEHVAISIMMAPCDSDPRRIYITGPRATRWPDGEDMGRRVMRALALATQTVGSDLLVV